MQKKERSFATLLVIVMLLLCAVCYLTKCTAYNPSLYPSYDVLNPGPEVRKNPLGFTEDGNVIVNEAFMIWVYELKEEVKRLRKKLGNK